MEDEALLLTATRCLKIDNTIYIICYKKDLSVVYIDRALGKIVKETKEFLVLLKCQISH